jgi:hypothetical protein
MPFVEFLDSGRPLAPTTQIVALNQNTVVNQLVSTGTPYTQKQNVNGVAPDGDGWIALSRPVFGFSLWTTNTASIRIVLSVFTLTDEDWRGWRLYKNIPNVLTGYEIPPDPFKIIIYSDEPSSSAQVSGYVWVRSM